MTSLIIVLVLVLIYSAAVVGMVASVEKKKYGTTDKDEIRELKALLKKMQSKD